MLKILIVITISVITIAGFSLLDSNPVILFILSLWILFPIMMWFVLKKLLLPLTKLFFHIQKIPLFHLEWNFNLIRSEDMFIDDEPIGKKPINTFLLTLTSFLLLSLSLSFILAQYVDPFVLFTSNFTEDASQLSQLAHSFFAIEMSFFLIPIVMLILYPVLIIELSGVKVFLRTKRIITTSTSPFRTSLGAIASITLFYSLIKDISVNFDSAVVFLFFLNIIPHLIITGLFMDERKKLTYDFKNYLFEKNIRVKKFDLHERTLSKTNKSLIGDSELFRQVSLRWLVLPILFSMLGGIIAYLQIKNHNSIMAKKMLSFGCVLTAIQPYTLLLLFIVFIPYISLNSHHVANMHNANLEPFVGQGDLLIINNWFNIEQVKENDIIFFRDFDREFENSQFNRLGIVSESLEDSTVLIKNTRDVLQDVDQDMFVGKASFIIPDFYDFRNMNGNWLFFNILVYFVLNSSIGFIYYSKLKKQYSLHE